MTFFIFTLNLNTFIFIFIVSIIKKSHKSIDKILDDVKLSRDNYESFFQILNF